MDAPLSPTEQEWLEKLHTDAPIKPEAPPEVKRALLEKGLVIELVEGGLQLTSLGRERLERRDPRRPDGLTAGAEGVGRRTRVRIPRCGRRSGNIAAVKLSRHRQRGVALLTAVLLLLCQTAFAAAACAHTAAVLASVGEAGALPCHENIAEAATSDSAPNAASAQSACDAPKAVSQLAAFPIIAIGDMPSLLLPKSVLHVVAVHQAAPVHDASPCSSPPFTVLHCRFLN